MVTPKDSEEQPMNERFRDKVLEEIMEDLHRYGIVNHRSEEPQLRSAAQESAELFKKYEKTNPNLHYSSVGSLQSTAEKLTVLTQQIERQKRAEESSILALYDKTKKGILKMLGKPEYEATCQELREEKMDLVERLKQQLTSAKDEVTCSWNQVVEEKRRRRKQMVDAINYYSALENQLEEHNRMYERVSQQLESTRKQDADYLTLADAKDELRRRIEFSKKEQEKAKQDMVCSKRTVDMLHNHEGVMIRMLTQLDLSANSMRHNLELAYTMQGLSSLYREGKINMGIIDSMDGAAAKFIDIEKETRELSDVVMKAAVRRGQSSSRIGRLGKTIGKYRGLLSAAAESSSRSLDQEANEIINSCGE
jgi:HPt (histidine-containing phosphotransfer) domain-containing protein